jgi:O-antigen/teichoic acid export membrane protein
MRLSVKSYFLFLSLLAQGVRIVSSFALFRLLTPMDYGAVALVGLAPGYVAALGDFGALRVVYVLDGRVPKARGTCLSIALISSGVLALVCLGAGIYLGWVKNEPVFYLLGLLAALNAPLNSAYEFGLMLLNLERNFAFEANTRLLRALVTSGSALGMAWAGLGPVAISGSIFAGSVLAFVLLLIWHPRLLGLASSRETARKALALGMRMTGAQYLNNLNPTVVGTFATFTGGQLGLGLFGRATQLIDMFNHSFLNNLLRIFQPDLRFSEKGSAELSAHFCRACLVCLYITIPASVVLFLRAQDVIYLFMGTGWEEVAMLIRPLAVAMAINSIGGISLSALQCAGHTRVWAVASGLSLLVLAFGYWIFGGQSLLALTVVVAISQSAAALYLTMGAVVGLKISLRALLSHFTSMGFSVALVGGLSLMGTPQQDLSLWGASFRVSATVFFAIVIIYGGLAMFHREFFRSVLGSLFHSKTVKP